MFDFLEKRVFLGVERGVRKGCNFPGVVYWDFERFFWESWQRRLYNMGNRVGQQSNKVTG